MSDYIFELSDVYLTYSGKKEDHVLHIEDLKIPKGKIVFFLGASGSGKSTILEALGLMNNTYSTGSTSLILSPEEKYNLSALWNNPNGIAELRKNTFSFIFQNTNLMEDFTAYENVSLSDMIKSGGSFLEVSRGAKILMDNVGLGNVVLGNDKMAMQLSGGQRQRLSFVRALNAKFEVLFCDEPTGNLDPVNARELFRIIKSAVSSKNKTAIIVTHDVHLATEFGDIVVGIKKTPEGKGRIDSSSVYDLSNGISREETKIELLKLYEKTKHEAKDSVLASEENFKKEIDYQFSELFRKREGNSLMGKKRKNLGILIALFVATFLAIGFSNGSFNYLKEKMNNPFVQWVLISIPASRSNEMVIQDFITDINSKQAQKKFKIKSSSTFKSGFLYFKPDLPGNNVPVTARCRTFEFANGKVDPILSVVLSENNLLTKAQTFSSRDEIGLIITSKFLQKLGYKQDIPLFIPFFLTVRNYSGFGNKNIDTSVYVPVKAVVKDILGNYDIGFTDGFYSNANSINIETGCFNPTLYSDLTFFVPSDFNKCEEVSLMIDNILSERKIKGSYYKKSIQPFSQSHVPGFSLNFSNLNEGDNSAIQKEILIKAKEKTGSEVLPILNYSQKYSYKANPEDKGQYLTLNFEDLGSIERFNDSLNVRTTTSDSEGLFIDTSRVKEKKNFLFLSRILSVIAFLLIFFSALSISIFVTNLLRMHLDKIKMNIGTFMAFGLGSKKIQLIYLYIIMVFLAISISIGFGISWILGFTSDKILASSVVLEEGISFFELFSWSTLFISIAIFLVVIFNSYFAIKRMLGKTPGDLIYNR